MCVRERGEREEESKDNDKRMGKEEGTKRYGGGEEGGQVETEGHGTSWTAPFFIRFYRVAAAAVDDLLSLPRPGEREEKRGNAVSTLVCVSDYLTTHPHTDTHVQSDERGSRPRSSQKL